MEHRWRFVSPIEGSEPRLECLNCGLIPQFHGSSMTVEQDDLRPNALCFGNPELTADVVRRALRETGFTLYYLPEEAISWQELLGGIAVKDSRYETIEQPDMVALWLGDNGGVIAWSNEISALIHPLTHRLTLGADLSPGYDHDCDAKIVPRNPTQDTGWGPGLLV